MTTPLLGPVISGPFARTDVDPEAEIRRTYQVAFRVEGIGVRRRTFSTGIVQEDDLVNRTKAYLYAMALRRRYNRQDTPRRVRLDLTRTGIIP